MLDNAYKGRLFSADFLEDSIGDMPEWGEVDDAKVADLRGSLEAILEAFPTGQRPNESQTEEDLIWPILKAIGWTSSLRQQNLSVRGRKDVPDGILFENDERKARANSFPEEWNRYKFGLAVVESKRWLRPLDRRSGHKGEELAPSTQMLRYLRRVDDLTSGSLRWGILTNGGQWRLYCQGARSVSEEFFEIDLAAVLGLQDEKTQAHWLKVFALVFSRNAFLPSGPDARTFHQRALDEGRFYEERVANSLSQLVFGTVYPDLVRAIADDQPSASLEDIREAALTLLYRLLFILYAEDRNLLPMSNPVYEDYSLRSKVRGPIGDRKDRGEAFSSTVPQYWGAISNLFQAIDKGDVSIGLPPYDGGLFDGERTPLLNQLGIPDSVMADIIDALSFERSGNGRKYINYRSLNVAQLGSIYERLLEYDVARENGEAAIRLNVFARKGSGSYYTPDDLVQLILTETLAPLVDERKRIFSGKIKELEQGDLHDHLKVGELKRLDPATALLEMKICDPAMGSGHFLVSLVDFIADQVIAAMAEAEQEMPESWGDYVSPLAERIDTIRNTILSNAEMQGWSIDAGQLDDRHIIRRMVLKRCVYGVDKNPMAVELAKVALWLHTFTVGAPLSFLDHHLRCGDSLFGSWVRQGIDKAKAYGTPLLLHEPIKRALRAASKMQIIEGLTDAEIAEAHRSADVFAEVGEMTAPLDALLKLIHALDWLRIKDKKAKGALKAFFDGSFGDPIDIAMGKDEPDDRREDGKLFAGILDEARALIAEERFLNWQVAFPGIWPDWENDGIAGGFHAVIGNPPWDRIKLQEKEWFAGRDPRISDVESADQRKRMIRELKGKDPSLADEYDMAYSRSKTRGSMARTVKDYPLLSRGDINLYSLFVERGMCLLDPQGMLGLLVPSGIASDKNASEFFKSVSMSGRLKALLDFENRRNRYGLKPFFPDPDDRLKFCAFIAGRSRTFEDIKYAAFLQATEEIKDHDRCFPMTAGDFSRMNPNTGTAPVLRSKRDLGLIRAIYDRQLPMMVNGSGDRPASAWPVKYVQMFHMTNDSGKFRTQSQLENEEGAWQVRGNIWESGQGQWLPLYEGKMVQAYDHRAASVAVNPENKHRPGQPVAATREQHEDPRWTPKPRSWVPAVDCGAAAGKGWVLGFKEITATTNMRTMIASALPAYGFGNKVPLLLPTLGQNSQHLLLANLNSIPFDFIVRQKVHGQTLNLYILEQLPTIPPDMHATKMFGPKTAAEIIKEAVLKLTYNAHDMAPFAQDMGHVDANGSPLEPFPWNEDCRLRLQAKLDAVFFHLYGLFDPGNHAKSRENIIHIYSTFPIVENQETQTYGAYRSRDLALAYCNTLAAGKPDAEPEG